MHLSLSFDDKSVRVFLTDEEVFWNRADVLKLFRLGKAPQSMECVRLCEMDTATKVTNWYISSFEVMKLCDTQEIRWFWAFLSGGVEFCVDDMENFMDQLKISNFRNPCKIVFHQKRIGLSTLLLMKRTFQSPEYYDCIDMIENFNITYKKEPIM